MSRSINNKDEFKDKLLKIIPSEIVAAYLAIQGLLAGQGKIAITIVICVLFLITFLYLDKIEGVKDSMHKIFSSISFLVWVYAVAPESILGKLYNASLASIILILWTLVIPLIVANKTNTNVPDTSI